jgi:hypothetical protein
MIGLVINELPLVRIILENLNLITRRNNSWSDSDFNYHTDELRITKPLPLGTGGLTQKKKN